MWPFKKKKKSENIMDALIRIGLDPKPYTYSGEGGVPPDDGKIYGEYVVEVDGIKISFYLNPVMELQAIKAQAPPMTLFKSTQNWRKKKGDP